MKCLLRKKAKGRTYIGIRLSVRSRFPIVIHGIRVKVLREKGAFGEYGSEFTKNAPRQITPRYRSFGLASTKIPDRKSANGKITHT